MVEKLFVKFGERIPTDRKAIENCLQSLTRDLMYAAGLNDQLTTILNELQREVCNDDRNEFVDLIQNITTESREMLINKKNQRILTIYYSTDEIYVVKAITEHNKRQKLSANVNYALFQTVCGTETGHSKCGIIDFINNIYYYNGDDYVFVNMDASRKQTLDQLVKDKKN